MPFIDLNALTGRGQNSQNPTPAATPTPAPVPAASDATSTSDDVMQVVSPEGLREVQGPSFSNPVNNINKLEQMTNVQRAPEVAMPQPEPATPDLDAAIAAARAPAASTAPAAPAAMPVAPVVPQAAASTPTAIPVPVSPASSAVAPGVTPVAPTLPKLTSESKLPTLADTLAKVQTDVETKVPAPPIAPAVPADLAKLAAVSDVASTKPAAPTAAVNVVDLSTGATSSTPKTADTEMIIGTEKNVSQDVVSPTPADSQPQARETNPVTDNKDNVDWLKLQPATPAAVETKAVSASTEEKPSAPVVTEAKPTSSDAETKPMPPAPALPKLSAPAPQAPGDQNAGAIIERPFAPMKPWSQPSSLPPLPQAAANNNAAMSQPSASIAPLPVQKPTNAPRPIDAAPIAPQKSQGLAPMPPFNAFQKPRDTKDVGGNPQPQKPSQVQNTEPQKSPQVQNIEQPQGLQTKKYTLQELLAQAVKMGASDLHLTVGYRAIARVDGKLMPVQSQQLEDADMVEMLKPVTANHKLANLEKDNDLDLSYDLEKPQARFRVNIFRQRGSLSAVFRVIPDTIRTPEELNLPAIIKELTNINQGLVLVTGPTGSGKTTTLASLINHINLSSPRHIITIEDPVEYIYPKGLGLVDQRAVYVDTENWRIALRSALRQDPDVVMIGEMRDVDTMESALQVAETGHLVFSTLHTNSASQTIDRIIDAFPDDKQSQVRTQLATVLMAVISQRLIPVPGGGRRVAMELMLVSPAIRSAIRDKKVYQIDNMIQTSAELGMVTLEKSLVGMVREGIISVDLAQAYANKPDDILSMLGRNY